MGCAQGRLTLLTKEKAGQFDDFWLLRPDGGTALNRDVPTSD